mmetsp:Transcript_19798/g.32848  ORF Transcript_19798/g.32848 Transcript_19798/m.32848 type:complete len:174 (-) Transcript_19798:281-802(-)
MKSFGAVLVVALVSQAAAFGSGSAFTGSKLSNSVANSGSMSMEYIPNGMTKAQWAKIKNADKNKTKGKNLGQSGITTFQSRSFSDWQKAGGKNLFPVDPNSVKSTNDLPYMQRPGGKADNSDLKSKKSGGMFGMFNKKEVEKPAAKGKAAKPVARGKAAKAAAPEEKKNWWSL